MGKLVTDYLDEYSQAMVGHKGWAYLDCMTTREQLDVIQNYNHREADQKYIVIVFERNKMSERHFERCEELGLNQDEDQGFNKEEMEEEWLENNP